MKKSKELLNLVLLFSLLPANPFLSPRPAQDPAAPSPARALVVSHVLGCRRELLVTLDDLVDAVEEIFFGHALPASPDGIHARLCAHRAQFRSSGVRTQPGEEFEPTRSSRALR